VIAADSTGSRKRRRTPDHGKRFLLHPQPEVRRAGKKARRFFKKINRLVGVTGYFVAPTGCQGQETFIQVAKTKADVLTGGSGPSAASAFHKPLSDQKAPERI
jgi:hypothetical protein